MFGWINSMLRRDRPGSTDLGRRRLLVSSLAAMGVPTGVSASTGDRRAEDLLLVRALACVDNPVLAGEVAGMLQEISGRLPEASEVFDIHRLFAQRYRRGYVLLEPDLEVAPLRAACDEARRISFSYTNLNGAVTERSALPLEVVPAPNGAQLLAHCCLRNAQRKFFLREIRHLRVDETSFAARRSKLLLAALEDARESFRGPREPGFDYSE